MTILRNFSIVLLLLLFGQQHVDAFPSYGTLSLFIFPQIPPLSPLLKKDEKSLSFFLSSFLPFFFFGGGGSEIEAISLSLTESPSRLNTLS